MMIPVQTNAASVMKEFIDCLSQQLSELDLLKSMYPNQGEITISDKCIVEEIKKFIDGVSEYIPNNLEFVINLVIDNIKLEVSVNLPVLYPNEEPNINVRCNQLNRQQESHLNKELLLYVKTNLNGEVCLYTAITWLQDNIDAVVKNQNDETVKNLVPVKCLKAEPFTRFWIYSHHIYNRRKREEISKLTKVLKLTGFCLPGKPGIICVEGDESSCKEYWQYIKSMNWKKINIRKIETFEYSEIYKWRRFTNFEELRFDTSVTTTHANMSEFSKFMSKHNLSDIFNELFGIDEC